MSRKKMDLASLDLPVAIGQVIAGRYAVAKFLGSGGMGVVLGGRHLELGERVAIKFLHKEHAEHADRFFREARAAARIRSEHAVRIFDVGRLPTGEPYIVMEHLEGEDLSERLEKNGPMDPAYVADTLLDVCQALSEAHAAGIVHRDIKPANIFLARSPGGDELVKLLDFGVAKVPDAGAITKTASMLGSPVYMSPEQLMASRDVDARSDVWSLGIVIYELLTNSLPFTGDSLVHLGILVREKPTPKVRELRPELPEAIDEIVGCCLAKQRNNRYADVGELAEALAPFASPRMSHSIPRIRRVLAEGRRKAALASTESDNTSRADDDDEDENEQEHTANAAPAAEDEVSLEDVSTPSSGRHHSDAKTRRLLSASLAAVSTSAPSASKGEPAVEEAEAANDIGNISSTKDSSWRGRIMKLAMVVAVFLALLVVLARQLLFTTATPATATTPSAIATTTTTTTASTAAATASTSTTPAPEPAASLTAASSSPPASPSPPRVSSVGGKIARTASSPPPLLASSPTAPPVLPPIKPTVNCNPPYTIDEHGVRRPKSECL